MAAVPAAISVRDLRKSFGGREVVSGLSFDVEAGECFGLLGHNGAGKTTTIEILEGFGTRDAGLVSVLGEDPGRPSRRWRERIGIVLQEVQLVTSLKVSETVSMFADLYPRPRSVAEVIDLVGLDHLASARVSGLSGGEKRRLDVALGLIGDPELIFLDEPTTGFDPAARRDAWTMIAGLKASGVTVVLTTHYMDEAEHLADRLAILAGGQLRAMGTFAELVGGLERPTRISFRLPFQVSEEAFRVATGLGISVDGSRVTVPSRHPQRDVNQLTGWAEQRGLALHELEVRPVSLEDVFLELGVTSPEVGP